jgi:hypothetical protein
LRGKDRAAWIRQAVVDRRADAGPTHHGVRMSNVVIYSRRPAISGVFESHRTVEAGVECPNI